MVERLQKIISSMGIASRRQAEELILSKRVKLNNNVAKIGDKADIKKDLIQIDGKPLHLKPKTIVYALNKPVGYISTSKDKHAKKKIVDLVPAKPKIWPVGRLDKNSSGLIVLTNNGELTQKLTHPSYKHIKEYEVELNKKVTEIFLEQLKKGVKLEEGLAQVDKVKKISDTKICLQIHQGWKRQIRRMCSELGYKVKSLVRTKIGKLKLSKLGLGQYKVINQKDII